MPPVDQEDESSTSPVVHLRRLAGASVVGVASGLASAGFLHSLGAVTRLRGDEAWLLWCLPALGLVSGLAMDRWGGRARRGVRLTMAEIEDLRGGVPFRMAPMAWAGTLLTHLGGGSAGREGTALQMATGITDGVGRRVGLSIADRRVLLIAALAGGFGSVFGVPWAGAVFAVEVAPAPWRRRLAAGPACVAAAWIGHLTVAACGVDHDARPVVSVGRVEDLWGVAVAGAVLGVLAAAFLIATELVRSAAARVPWAPARPALGGALVVVATVVAGTRAYNGLSLPLLDAALRGDAVSDAAALVKGGFTALTVGSGLLGGEVTPLFVMGATGGAALAGPLGVPVSLLAPVGMAAIFGAAANAPVASVVLGVELFGWRAAPFLAVACLTARLCSTARHLYEHR